MKKIISTLIIVLILSNKTQSQDATPNVYIYENRTNIAKDSLFKMAKLNINDTSYIIDKFTYVITGLRTDGAPRPIYGTNKGNKFCKDLLEEIAKYQSSKSTLFITDVFIHHPTKYFGASKKIAKSLNINF